MADLTVDVVAVGGGATGAGIARDAAMRGLVVAPVGRADLAQDIIARHPR